MLGYIQFPLMEKEVPMKKALVALVALLLAVPQSYAGMIATPSPERERVLSIVERPEVARQLEKFGILPVQARDRVAAMSEAEVASLAGKLESLPAGGALSNQDLVLIVLVTLLVIVLVIAL